MNASAGSLEGLRPDDDRLDELLPRDLLDAAIVAGRLHRSLDHLRRAARRGTFPEVWDLGGGRYGVSFQDLQRWVQDRRMRPAESRSPVRIPRGMRQTGS